jgi:hypothetical protein
MKAKAGDYYLIFMLCMDWVKEYTQHKYPGAKRVFRESVLVEETKSCTQPTQ